MCWKVQAPLTPISFLFGLLDEVNYYSRPTVIGLLEVTFYSRRNFFHSIFLLFLESAQVVWIPSRVPCTFPDA